MKILLWHVHGSWTDAFVRGTHDYYLPTLPEGGPWGLGRGGRDWPDSVHEVHPEDLGAVGIDLVVLQRPEEYAEVRRLLGAIPGEDVPAIYLEHNTPRGDVPDTVHPMAVGVRGPSAMEIMTEASVRAPVPIVHVTHYNALMWDCGSTPTTVIEHGIRDPGPLYTGELDRAVVVSNEPVRRWRVTGTDLLVGFSRVTPLDVFGIATETLGHAALTEDDRILGLGDVPLEELHIQMGLRRLYLHPVRWTSLGLSLLEAMHLGMPVVALGTTEAYRAVPPDAGFVSTSVAELHEAVRNLMADPVRAREMGAAARDHACSHYGLERFLRDWDAVLGSAVLGSAVRTTAPLMRKVGR